MLSQLIESLESSICNLTHFVGIKVVPFLAVELMEKTSDLVHVFHVDKCVSDIAFVLEVNRQIEKVVGTKMS